MTFNLTINVTARDVTDATIGVGRVGLNAALQVSQTPVKVSETIMSMLIGPPLTIPNLVVLRLAIFVEAADYTAERAIISFDDGQGAWTTTNPHLMPSGSKTDLAIIARLGVMRFAPVKTLPDCRCECILLTQHRAALPRRQLSLRQGLSLSDDAERRSQRPKLHFNGP
jgi:hypothetical protein